MNVFPSELQQLEILALVSRVVSQIRPLYTVDDRHTCIAATLDRARSHDWSGNVASSRAVVCVVRRQSVGNGAAIKVERASPGLRSPDRKRRRDINFLGSSRAIFAHLTSSDTQALLAERVISEDVDYAE